MTSPGEANVVPIALTLDGRTGYTVWAAPWVEDGEEWQAFLGAGSRVFVFEDLSDLADYIGSGAENDLSDHPAWSMLQTLPADQLAPDEDYTFDVDEVPALTEMDADDDVVVRVGDTVDMVQRIAECCDDGPLLHLLDSPAFAALLNEEPGVEGDAEDDEGDEGDEGDDADGDGDADGGDGQDADTGTAVKAGSVEQLADADDGQDAEDREETDDDPWAEIGSAVRTSWPLLIRRLGECLQWFAPGEHPDIPEPDEDARPADPATAVAGVGGVTGPPARLGSAQAALRDKDTAEADEKATAFWNDIGITPVLILGHTSAGYTLRCYLDDEPRFLGADLTIDVFRSPEALAAFCQTEDEHDLAELDTWPQVRGTDPLPVLPAPEDVYDLGAAEAQLHAGPAGADVVVLRRATDFLLDVAEYCDLVGVQESLADDALLGHAIGGILHSGTGSILAGQWNGEEPAALWRAAVAEVESCLRWHD